MFLDNFNTDDPNDMERLFSYIDQDKFKSLSYEEQDEFLDFLLESAGGQYVGSNKLTTIGIVQGSNKTSSIQDAINDIGKDKLKELLRDSIISGAMHVNKVGLKDVEGALERVKNGEGSPEDMALLDSILSAKTGHHVFGEKEQNNVDFSTFAIIKAYCTYFDFDDPDEENEFLKDIEPLINATYCIAVAGVISDDCTSLGKMFKKHGYDKVQKDIIDLTIKLSDLIVNYSKENLIDPEKTFLALLNVLKIIAGPLCINLDRYDQDKIEEMLFSIMFTERNIEHVMHHRDGSIDEDEHIDIDDIIKDSMIKDKEDVKESVKDITESKNESNKSLANANKMDSKTKVDIRKLLLDD